MLRNPAGWLLCLAAACAHPPPPAATRAPAVERRYVYLTMGRPAGRQRTRIDPNGDRWYFYEFNDRGRGPKLATRVVTGADHIPRLVETTGTNYFKKPVDERFSLEGAQAKWKNDAEQGEKALSEKAFYLSYHGPPEEEALLAQALLAAPGGKLALLPAGEASIERVGERQIEAGGGSRTVVLYQIAGVDFSPTAIWLDQDQTYFASVSSWRSIVREGWEQSLPALLAAQQAVASEREAEIAGQLARRPKGPLLLKGGNLLDVESGRIRPATSVLIVGNRIRAIAPERELAAPPAAEVIDARGLTIMPGLWDMHVHMSANRGPLNIAAGVTTVRDLANDIDELADLRRRFDLGTAVGPRIIAAGFVDGSGPYAGPTKVLVDTPGQARAAVDRYAQLGYPQVKIYSSIQRELVPVIIAQARLHGMRVSGHIPAFMTAEEAVRLGFDEIQHVNFLFLNFLADTVKDTRTPLRFTAVAEHAAELDLGSPAVTAFLRLLKQRDIVLDPTLVAFEGLFTDRPGEIPAGVAYVAARLPPQIRRALLGGRPGGAAGRRPALPRCLPGLPEHGDGASSRRPAHCRRHRPFPGGLRASPRARALCRGGHSAARRAQAGNHWRGAGDEARPGARLAQPRKARGRNSCGWRSQQADERHPAGENGGEGWHRLRSRRRLSDVGSQAELKLRVWGSGYFLGSAAGTMVSGFLCFLAFFTFFAGAPLSPAVSPPWARAGSAKDDKARAVTNPSKILRIVNLLVVPGHRLCAYFAQCMPTR